MWDEERWRNPVPTLANSYHNQKLPGFSLHPKDESFLTVHMQSQEMHYREIWDLI